MPSSLQCMPAMPSSRIWTSCTALAHTQGQGRHCAVFVIYDARYCGQHMYCALCLQDSSPGPGRSLTPILVPQVRPSGGCWVGLWGKALVRPCARQGPLPAIAPQTQSPGIRNAGWMHKMHQGRSKRAWTRKRLCCTRKYER